jgi:hypothetical protein
MSKLEKSLCTGMCVNIATHKQPDREQLIARPARDISQRASFKCHLASINIDSISTRTAQIYITAYI